MGGTDGYEDDFETNSSSSTKKPEPKPSIVPSQPGSLPSYTPLNSIPQPLGVSVPLNNRPIAGAPLPSSYTIPAVPVGGSTQTPSASTSYTVQPVNSVPPPQQPPYTQYSYGAASNAQTSYAQLSSSSPQPTSASVPTPSTQYAYSAQTSGGQGPVQPLGGYQQPLSQQNNYSAVPAQQSNYSAMPAQQNNYSAMPAKQNNYSAVPSQQSDYSAMPAQQSNYSAVPAQQSNYSAAPAQQNNYSAVPSQQSNYSAMPAQQNNYSAVPSQQPNSYTPANSVYNPAANSVQPLGAMPSGVPTIQGQYQYPSYFTPQPAGSYNVQPLGLQQQNIPGAPQGANTVPAPLPSSVNAVQPLGLVAQPGTGAVGPNAPQEVAPATQVLPPPVDPLSELKMFVVTSTESPGAPLRFAFAGVEMVQRRRPTAHSAATSNKTLSPQRTVSPKQRAAHINRELRVWRTFKDPQPLDVGSQSAALQPSTALTVVTANAVRVDTSMAAKVYDEGHGGTEVAFQSGDLHTLAFCGSPDALTKRIDKIKEQCKGMTTEALNQKLEAEVNSDGLVSYQRRLLGIKMAKEHYSLGLGAKGTPLQFAALAGRLDNVLILAKLGASRENFKIAFKIAKANKFSAIRQLIRAIVVPKHRKPKDTEHVEPTKQIAPDPHV